MQLFNNATTNFKKNCLNGCPGKRLILSENYAVDENLSDFQLKRNKNLCVIGGSGSGKDYHIMSNLLDLKNTENIQTLIVLDPYKEQSCATEKHLASIGYKIIHFNKEDVDNSIKFNPLAYCKDEDDVLYIAKAIYNETTPHYDENSTNIYDTFARTVFNVILLYMYNHENIDFKLFNIKEYIEFMHNTAERHIFEDYFNEVKNAQYNEYGYRYKSEYNRFMDMMTHRGERELSNITVALSAQLEGFFAPFNRSILDDDSTPLCELNFEPTAIYIHWNTSDNFSACLRHLFLRECIIQTQLKSGSIRGKDPKTRIILNEIENFGDLRRSLSNITELMSTANKRNVEYHFYIHQTNTLLEPYGPEIVSHILGNCDIKILLGGYTQSECDVKNYFGIDRLENGDKVAIKIRGLKTIFDDKYHNLTFNRTR